MLFVLLTVFFFTGSFCIEPFVYVCFRSQFGGCGRGKCSKGGGLPLAHQEGLRDCALNNIGRNALVSVNMNTWHICVLWWKRTLAQDFHYGFDVDLFLNPFQCHKVRSYIQGLSSYFPCCSNQQTFTSSYTELNPQKITIFKALSQALKIPLLKQW